MGLNFEQAGMANIAKSADHDPGAADPSYPREPELRKKIYELERVKSELEELTYCVSHDLGGPLNMLCQVAGMIIKRHGAALGPEAERGIRTIRNTADQINRMLEGLLQLSRAGRARLLPEPLDMLELVQETWDDMEVPGKERARLVLHDVPAAFGDRDLVRQAVCNLLSNAVKFSSLRRPPRIEVSGHIEGGYSLFHIKDNGSGFRNKEVQYLFGVFKRLHGTEFEGTGVGLAIVRKIINRHGGKVFAEGGLNRGAVFHFSLPSSWKMGDKHD